MNRQMPSSVDAEQALLGSFLIYPSSVRIASEEGLRSDEFFLEAHRKIYNVIEALSNEGKPVDAASVASRLSDLGQLSSVGGLEYIMQLADSSVTSASSKYYIELIQSKALLRALIETAQSIAEDGMQNQTELETVMDEAEKRILDVTRRRKTGDFKSSSEVVNTVIENIHKMSTQKSGVTGVATGYRDLDNTTNGFQRGDLIILAARPSMGKTAFALNVAMQIAQLNHQAAAIFSLEMPAEQLISRMLSAKSRVPGGQLRTGFLNNNEWNQLNEAAADLKATKIFIDDSPNIRVSEIYSKCRKLQSEHGLAVILIDYIQLITGSGRSGDNRQQEVSEISRGLKGLARELQVPVIALSQLSRLVERREDKRPMLSDLRESGALEQDADIVMFLYRDEYYQREKSEEGTEKTEINIAKHRNGPTRTIELAFERNINAFYNYELQKG